MATLARSPCSAPRLALIAIAFLLVVQCGKKKDLIAACRDGDVATVQELLHGGADANSRVEPQGWTALHFATAGAHVEIVKMLLQAGADASLTGAADPSGTTGDVIIVSSKVLAQTSLLLLAYVRSGKGTANKGMVSLATDPDAERRYKEIESLLEAAETRK